jgi:hypothetical protein
MSHPIYEKFLALKRAGKEFLSIDAAEMAKLMREKLKQRFPGVKFKVRSHRYAGGSSVRIEWICGPDTDDVRAITENYDFFEFCGMSDLVLNRDNWLLPDGSMQMAYRSAGAHDGMHPKDFASDPPCPQAILIHYGPHISALGYEAGVEL